MLYNITVYLTLTSVFIVIMFRFTGNEVVNQLLNVVQKSFFKNKVQMFNDIASNAINIIYKVRSISN